MQKKKKKKKKKNWEKTHRMQQKDVNKETREREENKNTAVVDAFFRRHAVKSTDVLLFNCGSEPLLRARNTKFRKLPFIIDSVDEVQSTRNGHSSISGTKEKMESFTVAFAENEDDAKNVQQHSVSYAKKNLDTSNAAFSLFGGDDDIEKQGKEEEEEEEDIAARWGTYGVAGSMFDVFHSRAHRRGAR